MDTLDIDIRKSCNRAMGWICSINGQRRGREERKSAREKDPQNLPWRARRKERAKNENKKETKKRKKEKEKRRGRGAS